MARPSQSQPGRPRRAPAGGSTRGAAKGGQPPRGAPVKRSGAPARGGGKPGRTPTRGAPARRGATPSRGTAGSRGRDRTADGGDRRRTTTSGGERRANPRTGEKGSRAEGRPDAPKVRGWGGVARRGAGQVRRRTDEPTAPGDKTKRPQASGRVSPRSPAKASEAFRAAAPRPESQPPAWEPEQWIEEDDDVRQEASRAVKRAERAIPTRRTPSRGTQPRKAPDTDQLNGEFPRPVGRSTAPKLSQRLTEAGRAFERERYPEARKLLRPLLDQAPRSASVRELYGLTLYRLGKWREAIRELEAFRTLTGSTEQHPVLADCYRALGRWTEAERLWDELRAVSPSAELVAEGRIVAAGALADQGQVSDAIQLLERGLGAPRRPKEHHLRLRYALADLYERAGDIPRARELFDKLAAADPDFADVAQRRRSLG